MVRRIFAVVAVALALPVATCAQDDMRKAFDEFTKKAKKEYADFREKANKEYAEALRNAWQTFKGEAPKAKPIEKKVKPVVIDFDNEPVPIEDNEIEIDEVLPFPKQEKQPVPVCPIPEVNEDEMDQILAEWAKNHPDESRKGSGETPTRRPPKREILDEPEVEPVAPKPTAPVAPKPTEPVAPKPTEPVAPKPTEPVAPKPTEPVAPKPTEPVAPKPTAPTTPVDPKPTAPTTPVAPKPTAPTTPVAPKPTTPTTPVAPKPTAPTTPTAPTAPVVPTPRQDGTAFKLYGTPMAVRMPAGCNIRLRAVNNNEIASAWETLSGRQFNNTIRDCLEARIDYQLSDWAYLCMLDALAEKVCGAGTNEATLLMAFLYCQSGYKMRLAIAGGKLYMMYGTKHVVYDCGYVQIDGCNYIMYKGGDITSYSICNQAFKGEKPMSLFINKEQLFAGNTPEKTRNSTVLNATCTSNAGMIEFANNYPTSIYNDNVMSRWAMYANTPLSTATKNRLYPQLKAALQGKSQSDQLQILLTWIHKAFEYEYDDKVWGGDRAFFAEETLFYPYCDCEDRSILYTRLVRDLLGLKAILIYYPGHLACAVAPTEDIKGDHITLSGKRFLVCDPTYIGSRIGQTMPGMNNQSAQVILLE